MCNKLKALRCLISGDILSIQKLRVLPESDRHQDKQPSTVCSGTSHSYQRQHRNDLQGFRIWHQQEHSMCAVNTMYCQSKSEVNVNQLNKTGEHILLFCLFCEFFLRRKMGLQNCISYCNSVLYNGFNGTLNKVINN